MVNNVHHENRHSFAGKIDDLNNTTLQPGLEIHQGSVYS
jgi:hypothetical protein